MGEELDTTELGSSKEQSTHGGKREGAGRVKGSKNIKTKEKEVVEEELRQRVLRSSHSLITSQMNLAQGCQFLFVIETKKWKDKKGKWQLERKKPRIVKDEETIIDYLAGELDNEDDEYYFLTTQKPENKALDSLFDRTFGKAQQHIDIKSGGKTIFLPSEILDKHNICDTSPETKNSSE